MRRERIAKGFSRTPVNFSYSSPYIFYFQLWPSERARRGVLKTAGEAGENAHIHSHLFTDFSLPALLSGIQTRSALMAAGF